MRRVGIDEIRPGMKMARSLYYSYGGVMLAAGATLDFRAISKLRQFGYASLYIYDEDTEDVMFNDYIDEKARHTITTKIQNVFTGIEEEVAKAFKPADLASVSLNDIRNKVEKGNFQKIVSSLDVLGSFKPIVENVIKNLLSDTDICLCVGAIKTAGSYIFDHSIEVAIHSALIAKRLLYPEVDIKDIILGSLLHDIGYLFIPEDIVKKRGRLTTAEVDLLKKHTVYGYYLLKDREDISLLSAHIAYQHHEQQDGKGYPRGLKGENRLLSRSETLVEGSGKMHRYAEIVAVPNYYDRLISSLPFQKAIPPDQAIQKVKEASGAILNKQVVDIFLSYLPVYPVATSIVVTGGKYTGWKGIVKDVKPGALDKPVLRLLHDKTSKLSKPIDVDMREDSITIKAVW